MKHVRMVAVVKKLSWFAVGASLAFLSACSPKTATVHFKVNSEPEGAQVLYRTVGDKLPCSGNWIYLGNTPLRGVRQFNENQLENISKITMKVMHTGYHDQIKEWDGRGFWTEAEGKGVIFWTPEMIPAAP